MPPNKYLPVAHQYGSKSAAAKLATYLKTLQIKQLELLNEKQAENLFCFLLEEYLLNDLSLSAYVNLNSQLSFLFMDKNFGDVGVATYFDAAIVLSSTEVRTATFSAAKRDAAYDERSVDRYLARVVEVLLSVE